MNKQYITIDWAIPNSDYTVISTYKKKKRICRRARNLAMLLLLIAVVTCIFIKAANAYNCPFSTGSLSRGMQPFPDYLQCPHTNGNRIKVPVCDDSCNCYWITQCQ